MGRVELSMSRIPARETGQYNQFYEERRHAQSAPPAHASYRWVAEPSSSTQAGWIAQQRPVTGTHITLRVNPAFPGNLARKDEDKIGCRAILVDPGPDAVRDPTARRRAKVALSNGKVINWPQGWWVLSDAQQQQPMVHHEILEHSELVGPIAASSRGHRHMSRREILDAARQQQPPNGPITARDHCTEYTKQAHYGQFHKNEFSDNRKPACPIAGGVYTHRPVSGRLPAGDFRSRSHLMNNNG